MSKQAEIKKWKDLAVKELSGNPLESLDWNTADVYGCRP
jgi:hypothetical protein